MTFFSSSISEIPENKHTYHACQATASAFAFDVWYEDSQGHLLSAAYLVQPLPYVRLQPDR